MHDFTARPTGLTATSRSRSARTLPGLALVAVALLTFGVAAAQESRRPIGSLLPDTTVVAFHYTPDTSGHAFFKALAGDLDLDSARATLEKLGRLLGDEFGEDFDELLGSGLHGLMGESFGALVDELAPECPALHDAVMNGANDGLLGPTVLAISMSPYNPIPGALVVTRPVDRAAADGVYDALVSCYDAGVSLKQDDVDLHLFADGSDQPILVARVDGAYMASTDQDLLRSSVRLGLGSIEPSHISHRVGSLAAGSMSRGSGMTLDLGALADALEGLRGFLPLEAPFNVFADRLLASMRVVNGVAVSARVDEAGLVIETLVTVDESAAQATGETALLNLLTCAGCEVGEPTLIPSGAAGVWAGTFSPVLLVDWLDTWLLDLREMGAGDHDVRGLFAAYLDIDLDAALLGWLGSGWHTAQLEVYDTDMRSWLNMPASVSILPVTDEGAARQGIAQWQGLVRGLTGLTERLLDDSGFGDELGGELGEEAEAALAGLDMLSVKPAVYRGVTYERWRLGPFSDTAIAVFGNHLVVTTPASTIEDVIDVYLGAPNIASDPAFGPLLAGQPQGATSYEVIDVPRYLLGLAQVADLAAAPVATGLQLAVVAGSQRDEVGDRLHRDPADVPSFDDLLGLTDLGTQVLQAVAARTGVAVGTSEDVGGVRWTTWRLPLKQ